MAKVNLKHSGAVIDQQIDRVLDGSVVVENTLSALDLESKKPVDSKGIAEAIKENTAPLKDIISPQEDDLYIVDAKGNVITKIGADGISTIDYANASFETRDNGKNDFKVVDSKGNVILHLSENNSIDDIIKAYLLKRYITPAFSWIDDDFRILESDHGGNSDDILPIYQDIHDWMLEKGMRMDFAYIPSPSTTRMEILHDWEDENFRFLLHPKHDGWYTDQYYTHNADMVRAGIADCIRHFKSNNILTDCKILVWPGSSHKFADNIEIAKNYVDCGITANGTSSNSGVEDDRYNIQRLSLSLSATRTKTWYKKYIKESLERGDWLILLTHLYSDAFIVSDTLDETSNTTANIKEIVEYANSICPIKSTEQVWNERKFVYNYLKK